MRLIGNLPFSQRIVLLICSFLFCLIAATFISALLIHLTGGINLRLIRITTIMQDLVVFVAPVVITAIFVCKSPLEFLGLTKAPTWRGILGIFLILIVAMPALNMLVSWNESISLPESMSSIEKWMRDSEDSALYITNMLVDNLTFPGLILTILIVGVMTGFSEELLFRGMLQRLLTSKPINAHIAIWTAAAVFSILHFQFFGFFPRLLLGAFFGYLLWWSNSLWLPIIAHALNNSSVVIAKYLMQNNIISADIDNIGVTGTHGIIITVVSIILTTLIFIFGRQYLFCKR